MASFCFCPGCKTGYKSDRTKRKLNGEKVPSLFAPPKDPAMFCLWQKSIPRADRLLTRNDKVCEKHFKEDCIERNYETRLFDGNIWRMPRSHPILRSGSIPTIFSDIPGHSTYKQNRSAKKRKPNETNEIEPETEIISELKENELENNTALVSSIELTGSSPSGEISVFESENCSESVVLPQSVINEQFTFHFLKANIDLVDKQNSWWKILTFDNFIICSRWNSDYEVERKIVIIEDLTVKVFLKHKETAIGKFEKLISLETISKLIYRVEKTVICKGIDFEEGYCHGYLQGTYICKKWGLCPGCIQWEKEVAKEKAKEEKQRLKNQTEAADKSHVELLSFITYN